MRRRDFVLARLPLVPLDMSADLRMSVQRAYRSRRGSAKSTRMTISHFHGTAPLRNKS
jgi:hypothetical protein